MTQWRIWPPLQPDISLRQCLQALARSSRSTDLPASYQRIVEHWNCQHPILVCLTVRSAFDLVLRASSWRPDDKLIFSALNIPQMYQIARQHGLRPVPVDIDIDTAYWDDSALERTLSSRTRALVLAHLFGARRSIAKSASIAHRRGAIVIEDCAQAYAGPDWHGDPSADVSLFSFGPVKTATSLGGAIAVVRNSQLYEKMLKLMNSDPIQSTWRYRKRILQYMSFRCMTHPFAYGVATRALEIMGIDSTTVINRVSRNVPDKDLFAVIRQRPCRALIEMIARRLKEGDLPVRQRRSAALELLDRLPDDIELPTRNERCHGFWTLPILCDNSEYLQHALRKSGFDAWSLRLEALVATGYPRPEGAIKLQSVVSLPFSAKMLNRERDRLTSTVVEHT